MELIPLLLLILVCSALLIGYPVAFTLGVLFLLPVCFVIGYFSIELIDMAWEIREVSTEAGGLAFVYIQKTLIVLFPITLLITFVHHLNKDRWN